MSTYTTEVASDGAPAEIFEYLARFSNAAKWDPGVLAAADLDGGPPRLGSAYRLDVGVLGRRVPLEYRIVELDRPKRVVLEAENSVIRSRDVISVVATPAGGSKVTYAATLVAKGVGLAAAPLLGLALRRIGDRAAAGLHRTLSEAIP